MIEVDWRPSSGKLRQFGWCCLIGFSTIGVIFAWRNEAFAGSGEWQPSSCLWALALLAWLVGLSAPQMLRPLYILLTVLAFPIGWALSNLVLALIFIFCFVPFALWFRLIKRDELHLNWNKQAKSFWLNANPARSSASYYRPF